MPCHLAIDLGAGSGRAIVGQVHPSGLVLREVHRFHYGPRRAAGHLRWNFGALLEGMRVELEQCTQQWRQEQLRVGHQRAGDRHPLLLPSGELRGVMVHALGKAHAFERVSGGDDPVSRPRLAVMLRGYERQDALDLVRRSVAAGGTLGILIPPSILAIIYAVVERANPGSFTGVTEPLTQGWSSDWLYFSFVTLTTLGYGDISPVAPIAKFLVYMEAVVGVFYMAVLVASLVGVGISESKSKH